MSPVPPTTDAAELDVPAPIRVDAPVVIGDTVMALVRFDAGKVHAIHFTLGDGGPPPAADMDAFLCATLLVAMRLGRPLHLATPVSGRLLDAVPVLQERFSRFYAELSVVPVVAERRGPSAAAGRAEAAFFSAGVDSMHLALEQRDQLSALVFVGSFHTPKGLPLAIDHIRGGVGAAADRLGVPLLELSSNVRQFLELFLNWEICHGAALGACAHAIGSRFSAVHAGSTVDPGVDAAWGSRPELDPLWTGDDTALVYDGGTFTRSEKIAAIVEHPELLPYLQVCWQHHRSEYNCGRCEKCVRLTLELSWHGVAVPTLPPEPSRLRYFRAPADEMDLRSIAAAAADHGDPFTRVVADARLGGRRARRMVGQVLRGARIKR
jgi:hypothetical protein